jgi:hypothetical protein
MKRPPHPRGLVRYTRHLEVKFKNGKRLQTDRKILHFPEGGELPQLPSGTADLMRCCFTGGDTADFRWVYKRHT